MNALTHVFLPLVVAYAVRPDLFAEPRRLAIGAFGLLPDADKLLGMQGLLHGLVALIPIVALLFVLEWRLRGRLTYATLSALIVGSHLLLDFLAGGPVPLLFPLVDSGIGLTYPMTVSFGEGPLWVAFEGPLVGLTTGSPQPGYGTFGFIDGFGVASTLAFLVVYGGRER